MKNLRNGPVLSGSIRILFATYSQTANLGPSVAPGCASASLYLQPGRVHFRGRRTVSEIVGESTDRVAKHSGEEARLLLNLPMDRAIP